jgi:hypothetical protein
LLGVHQTLEPYQRRKWSTIFKEQNRQNPPRVKRYLEIIADKLSASGWSWGCVSAVDSNGQIFVDDAHRDDGQRFVVCADEKLTAFVELESPIRSGRMPKGLRSA